MSDTDFFKQQLDLLNGTKKPKRKTFEQKFNEKQEAKTKRFLQQHASEFIWKPSRHKADRWWTKMNGKNVTIGKASSGSYWITMDGKLVPGWHQTEDDARCTAYEEAYSCVV